MTRPTKLHQTDAAECSFCAGQPRYHFTPYHTNQPLNLCPPCFKLYHRADKRGQDLHTQYVSQWITAHQEAKA